MVSRISSLRTACGCLLAVAFLLPTAAHAMTPGEQRQFADSLYARGMHAMAIREYERLLQEEPEYAELDVVLYRLAESYREEGDSVKADRLYEQVLSEFPSSMHRFKAALRRGAMALDEKRYGEAETLLKTALSLEDAPDDIRAAASYYLGLTYVETKRPEEAEDILARTVKTDADSPFLSFACIELARVRAELGMDQRGVLALYRRAVQQAATPRVAAEALYQLGVETLKAGNYAVSATAFERLLSEHPADARVRDALLDAATAYYHMDRTEDALALAARAEGSDLQPEWLYLRANCLRRLDRDEEALKLYERLISDHPDHALTAAAGYETALMAFRAGDYAAVLDRLAPETAAPQVQAEAYWLVAEAARELERDKQAAEYYRWIVENAGDAGRHAQALYRLGRLAADAGTHDKASQHFRQLVETYPDHELSPQALFESGLSLLRAEAVDEAVADWTDLVKRYPSSPYAERSLYQKALAEVGLDAGERAIKSFRALLLRFPDTVHEVEANYWMGVLHEREDRLEKAEEHLRAALEAEPEDDWLPRVQYHLAAVLQKNGKLEEAAGLLQDVLQSPMREDMPSPLLEWLAVYELDAKAWDNALSAARQLISAGETPAWRQIGYYLLGRAELGRGANMEARRAFKDALEQGADTREGAAAALEWGRLALRFEDFEEAAEAFQAAASKAVADELMDVRAQAYAGLGDAAAGREAWEDAARYYLSVGLLFDDENIVPGALYKAVEAFERAGLFKESREALQVLRERYPESEWTLRRAPESE